jgi:2-alkyl-3-oxoalkanoate reductase
MKVLVTGSNGFLGAAVVERLILEGYSNIRCFVREGSDISRLQKVQQQYAV